mmetsp:Transcript_130012/g.238989  ORF Transcript_130012/g.238989 Transcript_130012/m.238989 type:complete len:146 (-) Transcript_130012:335-772(-)
MALTPLCNGTAIRTCVKKKRVGITKTCNELCKNAQSIVVESLRLESRMNANHTKNNTTTAAACCVRDNDSKAAAAEYSGSPPRSFAKFTVHRAKKQCPRPWASNVSAFLLIGLRAVSLMANRQRPKCTRLHITKDSIVLKQKLIA